MKNFENGYSKILVDFWICIFGSEWMFEKFIFKKIALNNFQKYIFKNSYWLTKCIYENQQKLPCTNNQTKYEVLILELFTTSAIGSIIFAFMEIVITLLSKPTVSSYWKNSCWHPTGLSYKYYEKSFKMWDVSIALDLQTCMLMRLLF